MNLRIYTVNQSCMKPSLKRYLNLYTKNDYTFLQRTHVKSISKEQIWKGAKSINTERKCVREELRNQYYFTTSEVHKYIRYIKKEYL